MLSDRITRHINLQNLIFLLSIFMFVWLCWYFYTGYGGPSELVANLVPIALMLQILHMHKNGYIYKRLPPIANHILVVIYLGVCFYAFYHFHMEYEAISIWRQGSYTREDFIMGLLVFLLVMELSRVVHTELFWMNAVLVVYTLWGYLSPIDFFWHPGTSFYRVITSSTVELSTGIYGQYAQIALTTIAAFLLLAAAARGFDAQGAMVSFMRRIAGKSRQTIPQTAVLASSAVGMISGSGAANATVVGAFTIPLMKRYGVPGEFAAAVETAASMGGLIMPPVMAVAGFVMAEFLGVSYWSVTLRGFALAFIYYSTLSLSVYLLSVRLMPSTPIEKITLPIYDQIKTAIFFLGIIFLTILMGVLNYGEQLAGLYTGAFMFRAPDPSLSLFQVPAEGPGGGQGFALREHPHHDRDARRDDLLSDAAAGDARHHGRPVHRDRLHQPHGGDHAARRRVAHRRADPDGLGVRLARRRRPAADGDLYRSRGHHRRPDAQARHRSLDRAFLLLSAGRLGRVVAADLARGGGLGTDRGGVIHKDHVGGAETVPAHHLHDLRHFHPLRPRGEPGLVADRRYAARGDRLLRHDLRHLRAVLPQLGERT